MKRIGVSEKRPIRQGVRENVSVAADEGCRAFARAGEMTICGKRARERSMDTSEPPTNASSPLTDLILHAPDVFHEGITSRLEYGDLFSLAAASAACRDEVRSLDDVDLVRSVRSVCPQYLWGSWARWLERGCVTKDKCRRPQIVVASKKTRSRYIPSYIPSAIPYRDMADGTRELLGMGGPVRLITPDPVDYAIDRIKVVALLPPPSRSFPASFFDSFEVVPERAAPKPPPRLRRSVTECDESLARHKIQRHFPPLPESQERASFAFPVAWL